MHTRHAVAEEVTKEYINDSEEALAPSDEGKILEKSPSRHGPPSLMQAAASVHSRAELKRKSTIVLSDLELVTGEPGDIELDPNNSCGDSRLTFKDVSFSIKLAGGVEKAILEPVSGHFVPGSMVALMGPSGCGKTTLLDILAGKKTQDYGGEVQFNGRPRDHLFPRITAYIAQSDVFFPHLTVQETVSFYSTLKTGHKGSIASRLEAVGLHEVKDTKIGCISGGQLRRVSLACGLASGAHIIFCDEPTSGLSSTDAESVAKLMRLVAKKFGITLVVAIHQPRMEVSRLFDHLLLLTANPGRIVYNGSMHEAPDYFGRIGVPVPDFVNPLDFLMDAVTPGSNLAKVSMLVNCYNDICKPEVDSLVASELCCDGLPTTLELLEARRRRQLIDQGLSTPVCSSVFSVRFRTQLLLVFRRQMVLSLRDMHGLFLDLAVAVVKSLVVGLAYFDIGSKDTLSQVGFFFMLLMTCAIDGMKLMPKLISERTVVKIETSNALYSHWAYIISFSVVHGAMGLFSNTLFVVLVFAMSRLDWALFGIILTWSIAISLTMDSYYLMVAAIAKNSSSAQLIALPLLVFFLLYNGLTVSNNSAPSWLAWALNASPVSYALQAITMEAQSKVGGFDIAINTFGFQDHGNISVYFLLGCTFLFRSVQLVCLQRLNNIKR